MYGIKNDRNCKVTLEGYRCDNQLAHEFNKLYVRFETHNLKNNVQENMLESRHFNRKPWNLELMDLT